MVSEELEKGGGMEETLVEWKNEGGGQAGGMAELRVAFGSLFQHLGGVTIARIGPCDAVKSWRAYIFARAYYHT